MFSCRPSPVLLTSLPLWKISTRKGPTSFVRSKSKTSNISTILIVSVLSPGVLNLLVRQTSAKPPSLSTSGSMRRQKSGELKGRRSQFHWLVGSKKIKGSQFAFLMVPLACFQSSWLEPSFKAHFCCYLKLRCKFFFPKGVWEFFTCNCRMPPIYIV